MFSMCITTYFLKHDRYNKCFTKENVKNTIVDNVQFVDEEYSTPTLAFRWPWTRGRPHKKTKHLDHDFAIGEDACLIYETATGALLVRKGVIVESGGCYWRIGNPF